jgi:hypothetical protein
MRLSSWITAALVVGALSSTASAFQEQRAGGRAPTGPSGVIEQPGQKPLNLETTTPPAAGSAGPEIRIPGLGKIGVLPKLDFGLELLYGANQVDQRTRPDEKFDNGNSDLQIRGTVKHKF